MTENLPLTLFSVSTVTVYLINAVYLLRSARMQENDDTRQRKCLLSAAALIAYAVFM